MSIALKHIKERRFLREEKVNLPSEELIILDSPLSIPNKTVESAKRPSQIVYTGTFEGEPTQISNNGKTTLKSEIKEKIPQTAKSLDSQTLKFWEMIFNDAPTLKEYELINILLKLENLEENPSNNTMMLNKIFKDEYNGYIKQTSSYSHIWEVVV
ncbi:MAG: hypothetical protein WDA29_12065 [Flavobacteriaceae bacterium]